jgi:MFS family permease
MKHEKPCSFSEGHIRLILIAILSLYPLVGMGIDLIAPSLPAISHDLNTSDSFSKNLITLYLLSYMLGNFLIGFVSDALGRRKPMLFGFLIFMIVSILPAILSAPLLLLIVRFLQGFTIAAFAVTSFTAFVMSFIYAGNIVIISCISCASNNCWCGVLFFNTVKKAC